MRPPKCKSAGQRLFEDFGGRRRTALDDVSWPPRWHHPRRLPSASRTAGGGPLRDSGRVGPRSDAACPSAPVDLPGPVALRAFGDESIRTSAAGSFYVLAAAVIPADRCVPVRDALRSLLLRRQTRLHWRDEDRPRRGKIASAVAAARVESLVVIGAPVQPRRQERARRKVLVGLLWQLDQRQVEHLLLESRQPEQDARDLTAVGEFRNARRVGRRLRVDHAGALDEPLLWAADAVAGTVGESRCGDAEWLGLLGSLVEIVDLRLD